MEIHFNILPAHTPENEKPMARYGICDTPAGRCLIADTDLGVCWLSFVNRSEQEAVAELEQFWGKSKLKQDIRFTKSLTNSIFTNKSSKNKSISVLVFGTPFQLKQWKILTEIKYRETISYSELAKRSGFPKAVRAAGTAIGKNNVSFLIPCHRIVRSDGSIGNYRWGADIKKKLLDWEQEK
jgi:AraC family transcriptional regulator of adaptative response/methylated-DNA-[protein]-cysteine methyltransferase